MGIAGWGSVAKAVGGCASSCRKNDTLQGSLVLVTALPLAQLHWECQSQPRVHCQTLCSAKHGVTADWHKPKATVFKADEHRQDPIYISYNFFLDFFFFSYAPRCYCREVWHGFAADTAVTKADPKSTNTDLDFGVRVAQQINMTQQQES